MDLTHPVLLQKHSNRVTLEYHVVGFHPGVLQQTELIVAQVEVHGVAERVQFAAHSFDSSRSGNQRLAVDVDAVGIDIERL